MNSRDEQIKERAKLFYERKIPVHLTKTDSGWFNGYIKELGSDFIIFNDFKLGDLVIFFYEIDPEKGFETYTKVVKDDTSN